MSIHLGVDLAPGTLRAVALSPWPATKPHALQIPWDPEEPEEAISVLRDHYGRVSNVSAAVDLRLLHVKRLRLPEVSARERRRILSLEPERFLPVRGVDLAFAVLEDGDVVFAVPEARLMAWSKALRTLGALERIEPAPVAIARALTKLHSEDALLLRDGGGRGVEMTDVQGGRLVSARRVYGEIEDAVGELDGQGTNAARARLLYLTPWDESEAKALTETRQDLEVKPPPAPADLDPSYIAAYGAALQPGESWREALLTAEMEREITWRHRGRLAIATLAFAAALVFAMASLDTYRARAERTLDSRIATLRQQAAPALDLQSRSETLLRELSALAEIREGRPDVLSGLLELSQNLPVGSWLQSLRITDGEWQIDGYARDAAALIPLLEAGPGFEEVRFLSGTNRTRVGGETYENFSLAFRRVDAP